LSATKEFITRISGPLGALAIRRLRDDYWRTDVAIEATMDAARVPVQLSRQAVAELIKALQGCL